MIACLAFASQAVLVHAQSGQKQESGSSTKEPVSRAFANGYNVPSTGLALEGYCPVCYIAANKAAKGSKEYPYTHQGVTYWFVSDEVRQTFIANPEKYMPAYGGWCATGVALGQRLPVDPTNFKVVNGRIMLFLKNEKIDCAEIWNQNEADNLTKANTNWPKLKG